ncbi:hypothetical protein JCM5353_001098 [Sporobolomyces roseus]
MVNQGKIPRAEIEQAWEAAQRPVIRKQNLRGGLQEVRLKDRIGVQRFARREIGKKDAKGELGNQSGSWKPSLFEGSLPDSLLSWSSIQAVCEKRKLGHPRDFLRRLLRQAGVVNGLVIIKTASTQSAKKHGKGEVALFFPWPLVKKTFQQFDLSPDTLSKEDGVTQTPTTTRRSVGKYIAHGVLEVERTLSFFGQPLRQMSPSIETRLSQAASGEIVQRDDVGEQRFVAWNRVRSAHNRYLQNVAPPPDEPLLLQRTSLAALSHVLDTSLANTVLMVEARAPQYNGKVTSPARDLYLPYDDMIRTLRDQGVLVDEMSPRKLKAKLGTKLRSYSIAELDDAQPIKISSVAQFENRMKDCQKPEERRDSMPWLEAPVQPPPVESIESPKGTKRTVNAVERTMGQLLTPAPSLESTPEPVPPPLKRVKSSGIVQTVSKLSITSAPSTPLPSPALSSPAPLALIPSSNDPDVEIADAKIAASKSFELETLRHVYETAAREGGASFLALDVEFWERDHEVLTEFGWSLVEFVRHQNGNVSARREDQHAVIKENQRFRNGRFAPDARDHFDFGRTLTLPSGALFYLLHALFSTLSATHPLFLIFHDPRGDIKALTKLGFDPQKEFERDLMQFGKRREGGGIWVVDTQRVFGGWLGRKGQIGLEKACVEVNVPTKRLHNAGNDAHYTLTLLEKLMDRSLRPAEDSALIRLLDERAAAAKRAKLLNAEKRDKEKEKEANEQASLKRVR